MCFIIYTMMSSSPSYHIMLYYVLCCVMDNLQYLLGIVHPISVTISRRRFISYAFLLVITTKDLALRFLIQYKEESRFLYTLFSILFISLWIREK